MALNPPPCVARLVLTVRELAVGLTVGLTVGGLGSAEPCRPVPVVAGSGDSGRGTDIEMESPIMSTLGIVDESAGG